MEINFVFSFLRWPCLFKLWLFLPWTTATLYIMDVANLQLQVIQSRACRIIFGLKKRADVDEKMKSLHWLKVDERIVFKILLLVYKGIHGMAPSYINELLSFNNTVTSSNRRASLHISTDSSQSFWNCSSKTVASVTFHSKILWDNWIV